MNADSLNRLSSHWIKRLLKSYTADYWKAKKEQGKKIGTWFKSIPKRTLDSIGKNPLSLRLMIEFGILLVGIAALIVSFLKD